MREFKLICTIWYISIQVFSAQNVFHQFGENKLRLLDLVERGNDSAFGLLEQQKALFRQIKKKHNDSVRHYYLMLEDQIGGTYFAHGMADSLNASANRLLMAALEQNDSGYISKSYWYLANYNIIVNNFSSAETFCSLSVAISKSLFDTTSLGQSICRMIYILYINNKIHEADSLVNKSLPLVSGFNSNGKINFFLQCATLKTFLENYSLAHTYYHRALEEAVRSNNAFMMMPIYARLADFYGNMEDHNKVIEYSYKALNVYYSMGVTNDHSLGFIYYNLGTAYFNQNQLDSSRHYVQQSQARFSIINDSVALEVLNFLDTEILVAQDLFSEALEFMQTIFGDNPNDSVRLSEYALLFAKCHLALEDYDTAIAYGKMGLQYYETLGMLSKIQFHHMVIASIYEKKKLYKEALEHTRESHRYGDSLLDEEKVKSLQVSEVKFDLTLKEYENKNLVLEIRNKEIINRKNNIIRKKDLRIQKFLTFSLISGGLVLALILLVLNIRNQFKKQRFLLIKTELAKKIAQEKTLQEQLKGLRIKLAHQVTELSQIKHQNNATDNRQGINEIKETKDWLAFMRSFNNTYNGVIDKLKSRYTSLTKVDYRYNKAKPFSQGNS